MSEREIARRSPHEEAQGLDLDVEAAASFVKHRMPELTINQARDAAMHATAQMARDRDAARARLARAEALLKQWRQAGYLETKNADAHDHHVCDELADAYRATDAYFADIEERDQ